MIEFKIISTVDKSQQATYIHEGPSFSFGQSEGDMLIDDPSLAPLQAKLTWQGNAFVIENLGHPVEIRLNGKPLSGVSPLKERDSLTVGKTTISFSRLDNLPQPVPEPYEHPQAKTRLAGSAKEKAVVDALAYLAQITPAPIPVAPPPPPATAKPPPLPGSAAASPPPIPPLPRKP